MADVISRDARCPVVPTLLGAQLSREPVGTANTDFCRKARRGHRLKRRTDPLLGQKSGIMYVNIQPAAIPMQHVVLEKKRLKGDLSDIVGSEFVTQKEICWMSVSFDNACAEKEDWRKMLRIQTEEIEVWNPEFLTRMGRKQKRLREYHPALVEVVAQLEGERPKSLDGLSLEN
ncbi:hypothetical protein C8R44DRAFT_732905 [Mycena epipterygia]|nr:hypothetical protein C8R44DRAFT_732905 [Mycena epipterygia]